MALNDSSTKCKKFEILNQNYRRLSGIGRGGADAKHRKRANATYEKGCPDLIGSSPSHGQRPESAAHEAFIARNKFSDNAPLCGLPTSLLNHETSVTSFRAVKPFASGWKLGRPRLTSSSLTQDVNHSALHNKSCNVFFWRQNP
ncbi:MAG: hypothetical protein JSR96_11605 [Proteobacteria bacterium]|nr:hypothetical protein [Pseudomonadota bacterium]